MSALASIGLGLDISGNSSLTNLDDLISLSFVGGGIRIEGSNGLTDVDGFANITSIPGELEIANCNSLNDLSGFSNVSSTGVLILLNVESLTNLDAFAQLTTITGRVMLQSNEILNNIDGLANLTSIIGNVTIIFNHALSNVDGFISLTVVEGDLRISSNNALLNVDGLANLTLVTGDLSINSNSSLANCCILRDLLSTPDAIIGDVNIFGNPSICSDVPEIMTACQDMNVVANFPCVGLSNGSIQVQMIGVIVPFTYSLERIEDGQITNVSSSEPDFIIENLSEGTYSLTVTDAEGTEIVQENINLVPIVGSVFEIIEITTINSSNGFSNGTINLSTAGGTTPYSLSWTGESAGSQMGLTDPTMMIGFLAQGAYEITVTDNSGNQQVVSVSLLDDTVPVFPCTEPLDIVILNDVSSSVDAIEYEESKQFFIDFLSTANIGTGQDDSRAAIVEWSGEDSQSIRIPMTGNLSELQDYSSSIRFYMGGTSPQDALSFGGEYLTNIARPDAARVLILSTDGSGSQISPSLVALADEYKAAGFHIITIAFDNAFSNSFTRERLRQIASVDALAPGAPAYSQLDQNLAEAIVNLYLCPIDPGSTATAYFNRDGAIEIIDVAVNGGCPTPNNIELTFTIEALRELSIPPGMPVTFYYNDPALFGASPILTWQVPCAIPAGTSETFTVTLPVTEAANIFAVLNDDSQAPPVSLPVTAIEELAYSNNIDNATICTDPLPTLQALKYTTTPIPICSNIVMYTVDVCNITELDASGVIVTDEAPSGFVLLHTVVNDNGCTTTNNDSFDIPGGCCVSITYTYDATTAANGNYNDQDVILSGGADQNYINFDGVFTATEDVLIDGTVDCPSTVINFIKEVNVNDICEDAFVVYTFTIDNQLNVPLQGLLLTDILPDPVTWVYQPYGLEGLSISNSNFVEGNATFIIDEVAANTVASFSMDLFLGDWATGGMLNNIATLDNVPDLENGDIQTLLSNTVTTNVMAAPEIETSQTFNCNDNTVDLSAALIGQTGIDWSWGTTGDGGFSDNNVSNTIYTLGEDDLNDGGVTLSVTTTTTNCGEINGTVEVELTIPEPVSITLETCEGETIDYNGTALSIGDMQDFSFQTSEGCDSIVNLSVLGLPTSSEDVVFEICENESVNYNGTSLPVGATQTFIWENSSGCDSVVTVNVIGVSSVFQALTLEVCEGETINYNGTSLSAGETQYFSYQSSGGCDSVVSVMVLGLPSSSDNLTLETCAGVAVNYDGVTLNIGAKQTFVFENSYGCDSTITVNVIGKGFAGGNGIPNIFSPNDDGVNDCFQTTLNNNLTIQKYQLQIFNRWGGLVFSSDDPYACWDGKVNNQSAETGIYVWFLEMATDDCEDLSIFKGDVMLMR